MTSPKGLWGHRAMLRPQNHPARGQESWGPYALAPHSHCLRAEGGGGGQDDSLAVWLSMLGVVDWHLFEVHPES